MLWISLKKTNNIDLVKKLLQNLPSTTLFRDLFISLFSPKNIFTTPRGTLWLLISFYNILSNLFGSAVKGLAAVRAQCQPVFLLSKYCARSVSPTMDLCASISRRFD